MTQKLTFEDYIHDLKESLGYLSQYSGHFGLNNRRVKRILSALEDKDPFTVYQASIDATLILDENTLYH